VNTFQTNTTRADYRFTAILSVFAIVLSVVATIGLLVWVGEAIDGAAVTNYLAQVGEALGR